MIFREKFVLLYTLRFFSLLVHAISTAFLYQLVPALVQTGLSVDANNEATTDRETKLIAFITLSLFCLSIDAFFLVLGVSLRMPLVTLFNVMCHSLGAFVTIWILVDAWPWQSVPYMFAFFIFPPFTIELIASSPIQPTISFLKRSLNGLFYVCRIVLRFTLFLCEYSRQICLQRTLRPHL